MMIFPSVHGVVLHIGKWMSTNRNNEARHTRIAYFFLTIWLVSIPPFADMWPRLPRRQHGQILIRHFAEIVFLMPVILLQ